MCNIISGATGFYIKDVEIDVSLVNHATGKLNSQFDPILVADDVQNLEVDNAGFSRISGVICPVVYYLTVHTLL